MRKIGLQQIRTGKDKSQKVLIWWIPPWMWDPLTSYFLQQHAQLLAYEVADLCLGKPPLRCLSASSATVADALAALKSTGDDSVSLWSCDHASPEKDCVCVGKICTADVVFYLCREENLASPAAALKSPATALLPTVDGLVRHVDSSASLLEAIDLILDGAQNLVVPIRTNPKQRKQQLGKSTLFSTNHGSREFCWLTQEDVVRFLLGLIGLFSPIPTLSIETLGIISRDYSAVSHRSSARSALDALRRSSTDKTSVAVVDESGSFIGEISPFTLSARDLMACSLGPVEELAGLVGPYSSCSSSSSDDELASPTTPLGRVGPYVGCLGQMVKRAEATVCGPRSSLVAVMIQAIARRVRYVWVVDEGFGLVGIVTFASILGVFRDCVE
ncbi:cystathionine beta-synthase family protein [Striga asiatica]|uniref:Cystathionine beta-synthase family protein n=1 Tax=Striga asiatica TaxID=4170 RepID=A0A5A7R9B4_STRAF|nr:cystathionine beta-synthase family protein [Striga asiatica]